MRGIVRRLAIVVDRLLESLVKAQFPMLPMLLRTAKIRRISAKIRPNSLLGGTVIFMRGIVRRLAIVVDRLLESLVKAQFPMQLRQSLCEFVAFLSGAAKCRSIFQDC